MENDFAQLYDKFLEVMGRGDEAETRVFLVEHFEEFPEDVQNEIFVSFLEEGLERTREEMELVEGVQKDIIKNAQVLERVKRILEDKLKVKDLMGEKE